MPRSVPAWPASVCAELQLPRQSAASRSPIAATPTAPWPSRTASFVSLPAQPLQRAPEQPPRQRSHAMRTRGDKRRSVEALAWDAWCVYREVKHEKYVARRKHLEKVVKVGCWEGVFGRGERLAHLLFLSALAPRAHARRHAGSGLGRCLRGQACGQAGVRVGAEALSG